MTATTCLRAVLIMVAVLASSGCYELRIHLDDVMEEIESRGVEVSDGTDDRRAVTRAGRPITNHMARKVPLPTHIFTFKLDGVITDVHTCGGGPTQARRVAEQKVVGFREGDPKLLGDAVIDVTGDIVINIAQHLFAIHVHESTDADVARIAALLADVSGD